MSKPVSGRYLSFAEREKIGLFVGPRYRGSGDRTSYWPKPLNCLTHQPKQVGHRNTGETIHPLSMLLMACSSLAYAAKQTGHSVEVFLSVYSKWIDHRHGNLEQAKLERFTGQDFPAFTSRRRAQPEIEKPLQVLTCKGFNLGWLMGLEPTTTGITILDSTN